MPAIELDGSAQDLVWLQAVKLFPRDKAHRDQLFTLERVRFEVLELGGDLDLKFPVSGNVLQTLLESPSYTEMMNQAQEAAKRACIAADILCAIYVMDRFSLPEPSLNKAMALVQAYAPTATYGDRSKLPASLTQIRKCWEEFKPVAHLWAATRINKSLPLHGRPQQHVHGRLQVLFAGRARLLPFRRVVHSKARKTTRAYFERRDELDSTPIRPTEEPAFRAAP
jgi:hypothetical protein